jgi:hypothetical protein
MTALRTDAYDALLWILDDAGARVVTRRYTGAEAALARAADEADDLALFDDEDDGSEPLPDWLARQLDAPEAAAQQMA